jgi:Tol biopolymer transport system component
VWAEPCSNLEEIVKASIATAVAAAAFLAVSALPAQQPANASADAGLIAFTRYRLQNNPLWSEIWIARPDGSDARKISRSSTAVEDDQAHFSRDGRWIVFDRCTANGPCSVWLVHANGSGQHRVRVPCTKGTCDDANASFAPDGRHLVVQHEWGTVKHGTIPDNDQIEHSSIVETNLDGSHPVVLRELDNWSGGFEGPRLTPDGRTLLFRSYTWHPDRVTPYALYVAPRLGGPARRITPLKLWASGGEISPDGRQVLFRSTFASGELTPGNALYTVSIDGRRLRRLIPPSFSSYLLTGSYSPDGRSIVFATNDGATGTFADVFTLDLKRGHRAQVTHTRNLDGWPTWGRE